MGKIIRANAANPYTDMSGNSAAAARFMSMEALDQDMLLMLTEDRYLRIRQMR